MSVQYLDGPRLRRCLLAACDHAQRQRGELNRINVFPVPDGDTGTNLALTVRAINERLEHNRDRGVSAVAYEAAQAAVMGARGNCGMLLSHFFLGFAEYVRPHERIGTAEFGRALTAGANQVYASLEFPVEGTILTVIRETAEAAEHTRFPDFVPMVGHLVEEARRSLARTPQLLPVLKKAGVVDAGAKGFVSLLEGAWRFVNGTAEAEPLREADQAEVLGAAAVAYPAENERFRFCTEALVRGEELPEQQEVRDALRSYGDSLIVIRSGDVLKLHIHTDEPEEVFAYLRGLGTLATHKAEDMRAQHRAVERAGAAGHIVLARRPVAIVTDTACDLPDEVIRAHGIHVTPLTLVEGDRTLRDRLDISAEEFHRKLGETGPLPTTSQPAPADFLETFARAAEEGEAVVGVLLGSTLSGTFENGRTAGRRFDSAPVYLADSLGASLLEGLLVLKAAELAELGTAPEKIVAEVARVRSQSGILFTVKTFERLIASGRVGVGRALVGRVLGIKPILGLTPDGQVVAFGKAFGTERARDELLRILSELIPHGARQIRFGVVHVGIPGVVDPVEKALRAQWGADVEILAAPATPVIATHLGIGAWGVAYMVED